MQTNNPRLHALMAQEGRDADDASPSGDAAVRAHLRFVADALAANAAPGTDAALRAFRDALPGLLDDAEPALRAIEERLGDAVAFEADKQFGAEAAGDPGLAVTLQRRIRVDTWMRWFLAALDGGCAMRPVAQPATAWMTAHQTHLADTIFAIDRAAKQAEMARGGADAVANPEVVNRIGQAAMLQGHVRHMVEAIARSM